MKERKMTRKEYKASLFGDRRPLRTHNGHFFSYGAETPEGCDRLGHPLPEEYWGSPRWRRKERGGKRISTKHNCYNCAYAHTFKHPEGCAGNCAPRTVPPCGGKLWKAGRPYRFYHD